MKIKIKIIRMLTKKYLEQFGFSNNNISKQENDFYTVYLYKNVTCLEIKANEAPLTFINIFI